MNAMMRFTLRSLRANRVRSLVTIAGVALAAALLTAVLTTFISLQSMLYRSEVATSGSWIAQVQSDAQEPLEEEARAALADGQISAAAFMQDAGFGELTQAQQSLNGTYLPIVDFSGDIETLCALQPSEGRLPEKAGEILLFDTWRMGDDALEIGSTLTLPVGERVAVAASGKEGVEEMPGIPADGSFAGDAESDGRMIADGAVLNSSIGHLEAELDGGAFDEELRDTRERTYTVVGFYDRMGSAMANSCGTPALTCDSPGDETAGFTRAFVTMDDVSSTAEVQERLEDAFPGYYAELHSGLLRYMGVRSEDAIWDTFFNIAAILAAVIIVACVSLIYNAFAISVAERTRQFALLASVGASQRQRRYAVLVEALAVALVGIPLGVLVGIGGCAATFAALGPMLTMILVGGAAESGVGFTLAVSPWALALAAGLTLITVLISAYVPAQRASRINVIDVLRGTQGSRASEKGAQQAAAAARTGSPWRRRGAAGRLFGIGGALARINEKRGSTKSGAASVSLALAIVLLMTAGSLSTFLGALTDAASAEGARAGDVSVATMLVSKKYAAEDGAEPTAQAVAEAANERFAAEAGIFAGAYEALGEVPEAEPLGWTLSGPVPLIVPEAMAGSALHANDAIQGGPMAGGDYGAMAIITYLDDASFDSFAAESGLDAAAYHDPDHPRAIGVAQAYGNDGSLYRLMDVLAGPGTVEVLTGAVCNGQAASRFDISYREGGLAFEPYVADESGRIKAVEGEAAFATASLDVAAVVPKGPDTVGSAGSNVQLLAPRSLAATQGFGITGPEFRAFFDAPEGRSGETGQALVDCLGSYLHELPDGESSFLGMTDYAGNRDSNRTLALVVNVFCLLFTVILTLIALANVFNTITNSLILRRREFAVMRSVGMSDRQFRSMILDECTSWCIRGLVPGIIVSVAVSYLLYRAVTGSMAGLAFALPWTYVALAAGLCALAVGISVAYGMRRCRTDSVVEALRAE